MLKLKRPFEDASWPRRVWAEYPASDVLTSMGQKNVQFLPSGLLRPLSAKRRRKASRGAVQNRRVSNHDDTVIKN